MVKPYKLLLEKTKNYLEKNLEMITVRHNIGKGQIDNKDLEKIKKDKILVENNNVISVFWTQFCKQSAYQSKQNLDATSQEMNDTLRKIIKKESVKFNYSLERLLKHEFIIDLSNNQYKMRVPLFEEWLKKFKFKK